MNLQKRMQEGDTHHDIFDIDPRSAASLDWDLKRPFVESQTHQLYMVFVFPTFPIGGDTL